MDSSTLLQVLPNLSIGVVSILTLGVALYFFVKYLEKRDAREDELHKQHSRELEKREQALRAIETEFRNTVVSQLAKNTEAMGQSSATILSATKMMDRLVGHLESASRKI